jgi:hypothetical protein
VRSQTQSVELSGYNVGFRMLINEVRTGKNGPRKNINISSVCEMFN